MRFVFSQFFDLTRLPEMINIAPLVSFPAHNAVPARTKEADQLLTKHHKASGRCGKRGVRGHLSEIFNFIVAWWILIITLHFFLHNYYEFYRPL